MSVQKRIFDLVLSLSLLLLLLPLIFSVALLVALLDGLPVFYLSRRMKTMTQEFSLIKFRTMKPAITDSGVSGGDKADRITRTGRFLRRSRLDELPQIVNVVIGDMSFVGPRPPLRQYVERFPDIYIKVLRSRPGITGLASVHFHRHETWLLRRCVSTEETDAVYGRACVPRKARLDLMYQRNQSLCFDVVLMMRTVLKLFRR
ncbi:undecaprenyl-phosphate glucose phosphotransferase [Pseudorhizobium endolithicum]|uniref:Undecaprenyl-phosphate glucose phosphotransferase n=1 Tax=Pseudorhizobium endolithicum TaxID=1191678 RepID=A0ABN7JM11_9HYPH|nr:undecaprenyl-phosphate glucose phosphotransferase [Pseudorhizobium endolithicum]